MDVFKVLIIVAFLLSNCNRSIGQTISGVIIDAASNLPISFVSIGIVDTEWGTISDEVGAFLLSLQDASNHDSLRCSYVGYEAFTISVESIRIGRKLDTIFMRKTSIRLREVVVNARSPSPQCLGVPKKKCFPIPLYKAVTSKVPFPQEGYRHEIGTLFENTDMVQLDSLKIHFDDVTMDTIQFRLNVYQLKGDNFVQRLKEPVYFSVFGNGGLTEAIIDISDHFLHLDDSYLITVENYKRVQDGSCHILANFKKWGRRYPTYYRGGSQSNWRRLKRESRDFGLSVLAYSH